MGTLDLMTYNDFMFILEEIKVRIFKYGSEYAELIGFKDFKCLDKIEFSEFPQGLFLTGELYGDYIGLDIPPTFIFGNDEFRRQYSKGYKEEQARRLLREQKENETKRLQLIEAEKQLYLRLKEKYEGKL